MYHFDNYTLSQFENGRDVTAYYMLRKGWKAQFVSSLWRNMQISTTDMAKNAGVRYEMRHDLTSVFSKWDKNKCKQWGSLTTDNHQPSSIPSGGWWETFNLCIYYSCFVKSSSSNHLSQVLFSTHFVLRHNVYN